MTVAASAKYDTAGGAVAGTGVGPGWSDASGANGRIIPRQMALNSDISATHRCEPLGRRIIAVARRPGAPCTCWGYLATSDERPPQHRATVARGQGADLLGGEIGVARTEVEPAAT